MAVEIDIFPRQMQAGGMPASAAAPTTDAKPLSASFAEMMAAAEAGDAAVPATPAGPGRLSASFAEMMAAADGTSAGPDETSIRIHDLDPRQRSLHTAPGHAGGIDFHPFGEDGLTIGDFIDVINPLQHIPIVGTIYRWLTGDEISPVASLAGGFLFGGPIGLAASAVNVAVTEVSGDDIGGNVMTAMFGESPAETGEGINLADAPERTWGVADGTPGSASGAQTAAVPAVAAQAASAAAQDTSVSLQETPVLAQDDGAAPDPITLSADQLNSLLAMGNGQRALNPLPPPGAPAKTPRVAAAASAGGTATADASGMSTKMMSAMEKYEAMLKARAAEAAQQAHAGAVRVSA